jgi:AraC family transcriptional regulator, regulatory protein of adaptative response / methylated-DNA-[protein]-cysteine methyltransferase
VPSGAIVSYAGIAEALGRPESARAVGTAVAANTIGYLVPCHRVLRSTGLFKNYRWGATRRYAMLGWEAAQLSA